MEPYVAFRRVKPKERKCTWLNSRCVCHHVNGLALHLSDLQCVRIAAVKSSSDDLWGLFFFTQDSRPTDVTLISLWG